MRPSVVPAARRFLTHPLPARTTLMAHGTLLPLLAAGALLGLSGCASTLSGTGGAEHYACKAPTGSQCTSVSGVYANAGRGAAPVATAKSAPPASSTSPAPPASSTSPASPVPSAAPGPTVLPSATAAAAPALRTAPRVLRMWVAPWEDSDGDLHDASTVHLLVDPGRWLVERVRPAPRSPQIGVTPPAAPGAHTRAPGPGGASTPSAPTTPER
jgi:conjugal transfer pilus assembly protein TraV